MRLDNHPIGRHLASVVSSMLCLNILYVKSTIGCQFNFIVDVAFIVIVISVVADLRKIEPEPLPNNARRRGSRNVALDFDVVTNMNFQMVQRQRQIKMGAWYVSFDSALHSSRLRDSMKSVIELVYRQDVITIHVVIGQQVEKRAVRVICHMMHVHGAPHQRELVSLHQSIIILVIV
jgi:hypothetical protein